MAATSLLVSASFRFCFVCLLGCLLFPSGSLVVAVFGWFCFFIFVVIIVCVFGWACYFVRVLGWLVTCYIVGEFGWLFTCYIVGEFGRLSLCGCYLGVSLGCCVGCYFPGVEWLLVILPGWMSPH